MMRVGRCVHQSVGRVERSETRHRPTSDGFHGAWHRARIRATRWFNPSYDLLRAPRTAHFRSALDATNFCQSERTSSW
jgi:hypothetical protein